jgi:transcriptional regulator with XRE-family HTH domain
MQPEDYLHKRGEASLTAAEVAVRTGYHRSHVVRIERGERQPSLEYTARFLNADALLRMNIAIQDLSKLRTVLTSVLRSSHIIAEHAEALASGATKLDSTDFDPHDATDAELMAVTDYICSVMLELVMDHKFHQCSDSVIDASLKTWSEYVAREAKKQRNRERPIT